MRWQSPDRPGAARDPAAGRRWVRLAATAIVLTGLASGAAAGSQTGFSECIATQVAYFERDYQPMSETGGGAGFENGNFDWVDYCGMSGIVECDYSDDPLGCQRALRAEEDAMQAKVLETLPEPAVVAGRAGQWSDALYPRVWALAHGQSAGKDCAGADEVMETWCEAREANGRLKLAILAWQVARFLDAAEPAVTAGWADPPPPLRPRHRPEAKQP